jgi:hypothetical protein
VEDEDSYYDFFDKQTPKQIKQKKIISYDFCIRLSSCLKKSTTKNNLGISLCSHYFEYCLSDLRIPQKIVRLLLRYNNHYNYRSYLLVSIDHIYDIFYASVSTIPQYRTYKCTYKYAKQILYIHVCISSVY